RDLAVARIVARLSFVDAVKAERGFAPPLAVEQALGRRSFFGHLTGGDGGPAALVELDVLALTLFGGRLRRGSGRRRGTRRGCGRGRLGSLLLLLGIRARSDQGNR